MSQIFYAIISKCRHFFPFIFKKLSCCCLGLRCYY